MNGSLLDILGVLIAFVTVLLILSMIVTGIVQAIQALFRMRARNLRHGLAVINEEILGISNREAVENANQLMTRPCVSLLWNPKNEGGFGKFLTGVIAPNVSWIEPSNLSEALGESELVFNEEQKAAFLKRFDEIAVPMSRRFQKTARVWTIVISVLVAGYFQVAAPDLLSRLSTDSAYRDRVSQLAADLVQELNCDAAESGCSYKTDYSAISAQSLEELATQFPNQRAIIEEASGIDAERSDLLAEMRLIVSDLDDAEEIVSAYADILDKIYLEEIKRNTAIAKEYAGELATIDIVPWQGDWEYYGEDLGNLNWGNITGVAMTAILLSFGAPFWFNQLQTLVNLRDSLKPPASGDNQPADTPNTNGQRPNDPQTNDTEPPRNGA